ncbi:hypothetical protein BDN72DRAFT_328982 [Pluteus cervinus]|uniref:Uncharacterized protein n=1 Tax=Pluteus cervinus TaxID=181527 RepID=A0ACD3AC79_9AGAR|nr:hypothetical protein BDN72DRAFT_328982 [Pluteus cervinus]
MVDNSELTPTVADAIRVTQYFTLASSTLYLYDLLLTFDLEVDLLWPSKWTFIKALYLLQRYLPLVDMVIVTITWQFGEVSELETCEMLFLWSSWSYVVGMTLSEVVLTFRTLAVWGNTTKVRIALFLFSLGCLGPLYWILAHESFTYHSFPIPGMYCFAKAGPETRYLCWTLLTVYDIGLLILVATRAFRGHESGRAVSQSTLSQVVYQDGVLYYLYLVALSMTNVVLILSLPGHFATLLVSSIQRILYAVLASRVVLHIREQAYRTQVVMTLPNSTNTNAELEFRRSAI